MKKNAGQHNSFTKEQIDTLCFIKKQIASSAYFEVDDFELIEQGLLCGAYNAFGDEMETIINELNKALAA